MVARPSIPFRSANAGELSDDAKGRIDIKQYYSAALRMKNIEPVPQGGFRAMGGSRHVGRWRGTLTPRAITETVATPGPHTGTETIFIGTVTGPVAALEIINPVLSAGVASIVVETEIAGVWTPLGQPIRLVAGTAAHRRMAAAAPNRQRAATRIRIRATFSESATLTLGGLEAYVEGATGPAPRFTSITLDSGAVIVAFVTDGIVDFYDGTAHLGAAPLRPVLTSMLPDLDFYAEGATVGVFKEGNLRSQRLFLQPGSTNGDWRTDEWPFEAMPTADLGGTYPKTDDVWEIFIRRSSGDIYLYVTVTVNGETTEAQPLTDSAGVPVIAGDETTRDWPLFATLLQAKIQDLPSLGPGVTVVWQNIAGGDKLIITFGGDFSGEEYQLSSIVTNTADASALATHFQIGKTEFEPLFSAERGWPGTAELIQDRMGHARIPAASGAIALSRIGEYFDLDQDAPTDSAPRLDRLRSQTSEKVLALKMSTYMLAFTDRGAYFVPNRTIERGVPLNFTSFSEVGLQANCKPFELEGEVHYVAKGGNQILQAVYDDISTKYKAPPISLLASHLVKGIARNAVQKAQSDIDAQRAWLMRGDGRLVVGQFIATQEITGFCEWIAADGGLVREIGVDGANRLWLAVQRGTVSSIEIYERDALLQDWEPATADLAGRVEGLQRLEGASVWAIADGFVLGPFTVTGAAIELEDAYSNVAVGRWQPPIIESMPLVYVTPGDDVIWRPGRIHTVHANIVETTSLAIGANGQAPVEVRLVTTNDPVDQPAPAKTQLVTVGGEELLGSMTGTTMVMTQLKPGRLRVRDYALGAKL